jgi:hypothetical protein
MFLDPLWELCVGRAPEEILLSSARTPADVKRDIELLAYGTRGRLDRRLGILGKVNAWDFKFLPGTRGYTWEIVGKIHRRKKGTLIHGTYRMPWQIQFPLGLIFFVLLSALVKCFLELLHGGSAIPFIAYTSISMSYFFITRWMGNYEREGLDRIRISLEAIAKKRSFKKK